jgi:hypothetical protein
MLKFREKFPKASNPAYNSQIRIKKQTLGIEKAVVGT